MMRAALLARFAIILSFAALTGCGGGGGSSGGGSGTNQPPTFTSNPSVSVTENASGTIYTATASDPENASLSYSLSGGADAARFQITSAGALSFVTPPDFDAPGDANRDNVYEATVSVSDGTNSATLPLSVTVVNATGGAYRVRRVATGLDEPVFLTGHPGSARVLVLERAGRILLLDPQTGTSTPFLDFSAQVSTDGERGLLGLATAPDFQTSGIFYTYSTNPAGTIELRRFRTLAGNPAVGDPASADVLLSIAHPRTNHNGGWIGFGPDGLLYVGIGDGGGSGDPDNNAQNSAALLGKILRLDVSRDDFPSDSLRDYGIPSGNPFATQGGAPEVWLLGLRNPYRNSFDRATGMLWIGDVGQNAIEEINLVAANEGGLNMGWPLFEGTQVFRAGSSSSGLTPPVAEYGHGTGPTQGNSVTGGYVYRGPVEALQGQYVFADFVSNNVWTIAASSARRGSTIAATSFVRRNTDFTPDVGALQSIASFGEDIAGNLYIVSFTGSIFRIEPQ